LLGVDACGIGEPVVRMDDVILLLPSDDARQPDRSAVVESPPRLLEIADEIRLQLIRIVED